MKTTYNELTLHHNLSGFILPAERYEQIYKNGAYAIPPVIPLYDDNIDKDATRLDLNRAEGKHKARRHDRQMYKIADNACDSFIMAVVDKTWYKDLEDADTFYTKVTAIKLLEHLTDFCVGIHTVDGVDIPQLMRELYEEKEEAIEILNQQVHVVTSMEEIRHSTRKFVQVAGDYLGYEGPLGRAMATWSRHIDRFGQQCDEAFVGKSFFSTDIVNHTHKRVQVFLNSCNTMCLNNMYTAALSEFGKIQRHVEQIQWITSTYTLVELLIAK